MSSTATDRGIRLLGKSNTGEATPALAQRRVAIEGLKFALLIWLILRIVLSLWGPLINIEGNAQSFANAHKAYPDVNWPNHDLYGLTVGIWNIYDTRHYATIAEQGYGVDPNWLPAYFPGLPLLIKAADVFTQGDSLLAGWLIANLSALIFFWYLYRLVEPEYGRGTARRTVVFSAVFPASFFLFVGYVEATFLALSVMAFYYAGVRKWWVAGITASYAALSKQPGIFLIVPLGYMYLQQAGLLAAWRKPVRALKNTLRALLGQRQWLPLLLIPAAALAYTLYRYLYIKAPITGATDLGGQQELEAPGWPLIKALGLMTPRNAMLGFNIMDVVFTLTMIALVVGVMFKVKSAPLRLYSLVMLIANLGLTMYTYPLRPEINMPRRALVIFPIFIVLGIITEKARAFRYLAMASGLAFMLMSALFISWVFVG